MAIGKKSAKDGRPSDGFDARLIRGLAKLRETRRTEWNSVRMLDNKNKASLRSKNQNKRDE
jgi:hypothetical protein